MNVNLEIRTDIPDEAGSIASVIAKAFEKQTLLY